MARYQKDLLLGLKTLLLHEREALAALYQRDRSRFAEALAAREKAVRRLRENRP